jgi:hypothetical protein
MAKQGCQNTTNVYKVLVGKPLRKQPLKRLGRIRDNNINMDLTAIGCEGGKGMEMARNWLHHTKRYVLVVLILNHQVLTPES